MGIERQRADSLMQRLKQERSWSLAKIKQYEKEVGTLRTIMRGYLHQIDSLNTLNKKLIDENVSYRKEITTAQMRAEMEMCIRDSYKALWNNTEPTLHIAGRREDERNGDLQTVTVYSSAGEPVVTLSGDTLAVEQYAPCIYRCDSVRLNGRMKDVYKRQTKSCATGISFSGASVSETRIVSPIPSAKSAPIPTALLMRPSIPFPASVTPRWSG